MGSIVGRGLQFISSIVLARMISPKEYGFVAISITVLGLAEQTTSVFLETALVQKSGDIEEYLNTTWCFNIFRYSILFLIIFSLSPFIASFFNDSNATLVIQITSFSLLLIGFRNIGTVYFRKNLEFKKQFKLEFFPVVLYVTISLILGNYLKNAWAIISASLISSILTLFLSYKLHSYRPKFVFDIEKFKELFNYGKWIVGKSFMLMIRTNGINIFIGKVFDLLSLGYYNRGFAFSSNIFNQITEITWKIIFPSFCEIKDDLYKVKKLFLISFMGVSILSFPPIFVLIFIASDFINIVLTSSWIPIIPIIQLFSLLSFLQILNTLPNILIDSLGFPKFNTKIAIFELIFIVVTIYPLSFYFGINGLLFCLCCGQIISSPMYYFKTIKLLKAKSFEIFRFFFISVFCTFLVLLSIFLFRLVYTFNYNFIFLLSEIVIAFIVYLVTIKICDVIFNLGLYNILFSIFKIKKLGIK